MTNKLCYKKNSFRNKTFQAILSSVIYIQQFLATNCYILRYSYCFDQTLLAVVLFYSIGSMSRASWKTLQFDKTLSQWQASSLFVFPSLLLTWTFSHPRCSFCFTQKRSTLRSLQYHLPPPWHPFPLPELDPWDFHFNLCDIVIPSPP